MRVEVRLMFDGSYISQHISIERAVKRAEQHSWDSWQRLTKDQMQELQENLIVKRNDFLKYSIVKIQKLKSWNKKLQKE